MLQILNDEIPLWLMNDLEMLNEALEWTLVSQLSTTLDKT